MRYGNMAEGPGVSPLPVARDRDGSVASAPSAKDRWRRVARHPSLWRDPAVVGESDLPALLEKSDEV